MSAPAVVLLHALGETRADWSAVAPPLGVDRRVVALDLRGHGGAARRPPYTLEQMSADVVDQLDRLDLERVDVIGHSLGGAVACLLAAAHPGRIRRLVLEDVGALRPREATPPQRPDGELAYDWDVVLAVRRQIDDPDPRWRQDLTLITAPTLVIAGGPTSHVPDDAIDELVARVPDARRITIPVGHLVHRNAPREWLDAVLPFLAAEQAP